MKPPSRPGPRPHPHAPGLTRAWGPPPQTARPHGAGGQAWQAGVLPSGHPQTSASGGRRGAGLACQPTPLSTALPWTPLTRERTWLARCEDEDTDVQGQAVTGSGHLAGPGTRLRGTNPPLCLPEP